MLMVVTLGLILTSGCITDKPVNLTEVQMTLATSGDNASIAGNNSEALVLVDAALNLNNTDPGLWIRSGDLLAKTGEQNEALSAYDQALVLNPHNATARTNRAQILIANGDSDSGKEDLEQVIREDPLYIPAYTATGRFLCRSASV